MLVCLSCGNQQIDGNFCESCGQPITNQPHAPYPSEPIHYESEGPGTITHQENQQNLMFNEIKGQSKSFFHYAVARLKQPGLIFTDTEQSFISAMISFFLLPLSIALFIYGLVNHIYKIEFRDYFYESTSLPFFEIVSRLFLLFILLLLAGYLANLVIMKLSRQPISSKQLFIKYAGIQIPFLFLFSTLALLSFTGIVSINPYYVESSIWIFILFSLSITTLTTINPVIIAFQQFSLQKHAHNYYLSVLTMLVNFLFIYIIVRTTLESLIDEISYLF